MSTAYLEQLERAELDELTRTIEHAHDVAHIALRTRPLGDPVALAGACGVCQDVDGLLMDCYDQSCLLWAAEFDRLYDLGGDNA